MTLDLFKDSGHSCLDQRPSTPARGLNKPEN